MFQFTMILMCLSIISPMIPMTLVMIFRKRIWQRYFFWLVLLILTALGTDITSFIVSVNRSINTAIFLNSYNVVQFTFLMLIYRELYLRKRKLLTFLCCITYYGFEIFNSVYLQKLDDHQTWTKAVGALILFALSIGYFTHLLKCEPTINIKQYAPAWINGAVFIYFGFSLYLFIMAEYVFTNASPNAASAFWGFHNFNNILKNCFFGIAIYLGFKKTFDQTAKPTWD